MNHKLVLLTIGTFLLLILISFPFLAEIDPKQPNLDEVLNSPSHLHPFGTDVYGRDVFVRTLLGTQRSLIMSLMALGIACVGGIILGILSQIGEPLLDFAIASFLDVFLSIPAVLVALVIVAVTVRSPVSAAIAVGIALVPGMGRVARGALMSKQVEPYVESIRALGAGRMRLLWRHVLPNSQRQISSFAGTTFVWALLDLAALDFLGLSGSPSTITLGRLIADGRLVIRTAPWATIFPSVFLLSLILVVIGWSDISEYVDSGSTRT